MGPYSILLAGATGLVGGECLKLLLADPECTRVVALSRRPLSASSGKLVECVVDFERLELVRDAFKVDCVLCALGTTIKQAGSQERFREVDHDYPVRLAELGLEGGASRFLLVSALGADPNSRVFYNRVKGEVERDVIALGYPSVTIVRPSLLLGPREEFRLGESIAKRLAFLVPPKYKPVQAATVAGALVAAAKSGTAGVRILESAELAQAARGWSPQEAPASGRAT